MAAYTLTLRGLSATLAWPHRAASLDRAEAPARAESSVRTRAADPDAARVAAARGGDTGAFRELVDRHRDRACALALRVLRSSSDAEECAQDAFVRAWRALPAFRGEAAFATWLHRIVLRVALDRAATLKSRLGREAALDDTTLPDAAAPAAAEHPLAHRVEALLASLSPVQRAIVTLHYWQGCPVRDIGEALGMPENTVKTHLRRARLGLRAAWPGEPA